MAAVMQQIAELAGRDAAIQKIEIRSVVGER